MRAYGIDVDDCPTIFKRNGKKGRSSLIAGNHEITFTLQRKLQMMDVRKASEEELQTCPVLVLTSDMLWNPDDLT